MRLPPILEFYQKRRDISNELCLICKHSMNNFNRLPTLILVPTIWVDILYYDSRQYPRFLFTTNDGAVELKEDSRISIPKLIFSNT